MSDIQPDLQISRALIDNCNCYAEGLNNQDWKAVRDCFDDKVLLDYAGVITAPPTEDDVLYDSDDWLDVLKSIINGFDYTCHTIVDHVVNVAGDLVSCHVRFTADHTILPSAQCSIVNLYGAVTIVGEYTNHYRLVDGDWKICKSRLVVKYSKGNLALFEIAKARTAAYSSVGKALKVKSF